jgi:Leucine-rich repeat (LRR) protein
MTKTFSKAIKFNFYLKHFLKIAILILAFSPFSCIDKDSKSIFQSLKGLSNVEISLSDYKLDSVPPDIGTLEGVKRLYITKDGVGGWTSYPPLSALGQTPNTPPFRYLPEEVTNLTTLQSLTLINLDIVALPNNIGKLQNLDSLILFQNKLTVSKEIGKLKKLKQLKYLGLFGNYVTASDLTQLKESIPGLVINSDLR